MHNPLIQKNGIGNFESPNSIQMVLAEYDGQTAILDGLDAIWDGVIHNAMK